MMNEVMFGLLFIEDLRLVPPLLVEDFAAGTGDEPRPAGSEGSSVEFGGFSLGSDVGKQEGF